MEDGWVMIYSSQQSYQIEMAKALLEAADIESLSLNRQDSAYLFGDIELYTRREDALKSRHLLEKELKE